MTTFLRTANDTNSQMTERYSWKQTFTNISNKSCKEKFTNHDNSESQNILPSVISSAGKRLQRELTQETCRMLNSAMFESWSWWETSIQKCPIHCYIDTNNYLIPHQNYSWHLMVMFVMDEMMSTNKKYATCTSYFTKRNVTLIQLLFLLWEQIQNTHRFRGKGQGAKKG